MAIQFSNNAFSILPNLVESTDTQIELGSGDGARFPVLGTGDHFYATIVDTMGNLEVVKVTARVGDLLTVERAKEGTLAMPFPPLCRLEHRITAQTLRDLIAETTDYLLL
jgi:hypothetical protein